MSDINHAAFVYSVNLLRFLREMQLITEDEYREIVRISAAYYHAEEIYV